MGIFRQVFSRLRAGIVGLVIEGPGRRTGMEGLIASLEQSGRTIEKRAASARTRPANQETLAHIIGIERWGQQRMRVGLGELAECEEYDDYRPSTQDWQSLQAAFHATRQETLSLSKSLRMAGVDPSTSAYHNQFGDLTLAGWMYYLNMHANIESLKIS